MTALHKMSAPLFFVLRDDGKDGTPYFVADLQAAFADAASNLADAMAEADREVAASDDAVLDDQTWCDLPYVCRVIRLDLARGASEDVTLDALEAIARWNRDRAPDYGLSLGLELLRQFILANPLPAPAPFVPAASFAPVQEVRNVS